MSDYSGIVKAVLIGIGVGIILPLVFIWAISMGSAKEKNYVTNGVLTECKVDTVIRTGRTQQVIVSYQDANGKTIKARGILNKRVSVGQTVQAYVLADTPDEVFYPAAPFLKWIIYVILGIVAVGSWIPLVLAIREKKIEELSGQMRALNKRN